MICPDGHRWYECKHTELANPRLGALIMALGAINIFIGLYLLAVVR